MKVKLKNGDSFIEVETDECDDIEEISNKEQKDKNLSDTIELNMEEYHGTNSE